MPVILINIYMLIYKHTGHETHDKIAKITRAILGLKCNKQLNEQITTAVLNIGRHYNM